MWSENMGVGSDRLLLMGNIGVVNIVSHREMSKLRITAKIIGLGFLFCYTCALKFTNKFTNQL
jgi:hypothetical protein